MATVINEMGLMSGRNHGHVIALMDRYILHIPAMEKFSLGIINGVHLISAQVKMHLSTNQKLFSFRKNTVY